MSGAPRIGERATLVLEISAQSDNPPPIEVVIRLPEGIRKLRQVSSSGLFLRPRTAQDYSIEIEVTQVGVYTLQASVYWQENGIPQAQHFYTYLAVTTAGSQVSQTPLPVRHMQRLKPLLKDGGLRQSNRMAVGAPLHIHGQIRYFDDNQRLEIPIRHVQVRLFEQNTFQPDQEIETAKTDDNGSYSFPAIDNIDPEDGTKRDVYVIVAFENDILKLTNEGDGRYQFQSATLFNVDSGDAEIDFALDSSHQQRAAGHIFNAIQDESDFVRECCGWQRSQVQVKWPARNFDSAAFFPGDDFILISTNLQWERTAMLHEYGHAIMYSAYGNGFPKTNRSGAHFIFTVSDEGFALIEGWAEFMEAVVDDNAFNLRERLNRNLPNAETNDWWRGGFAGRGNNTDGKIVEGAVASILWDIADTPSSIDHQIGVDDDKIGDEFPRIWQMLIEDKPQSVVDFWHGWLRRGYGSVVELREIYFDHAIVLPLPPPLSTGRVLSIPADLSASPNEKDVLAPINLDDFTGVTGGSLRLTYDAQLLSPVKASTTEATKTFALSADLSTSGEIRIAFQSAIGLTEKSGTIFTLTFNIPGEAAIGQSTELIFTQATLRDQDGTTIAVRTQDGRFAIEGLIGDLNRDGLVDAA
ncbi:MAG: cohesin domain-containing protein, partial [Candidatus Poribacteria bacterium]|nr:cohesin domain-containing protein [Candidatus Poribacteria bacterium]